MDQSVVCGDVCFLPGGSFGSSLCALASSQIGENNPTAVKEKSMFIFTMSSKWVKKRLVSEVVAVHIFLGAVS
jgi:hypothetical protein